MNLKIKRKTKRKNKQRIKRKTKRAFCSRRMFGGLNNASSLNKQLTQSLNTNLTEKLTETLYSIITTAELAYSKLQSTTQNALKNINLAMNFLDNQSEVIQKLERINKVLDNPIVKQQIIEFEKKIPIASSISDIVKGEADIAVKTAEQVALNTAAAIPIVSIPVDLARDASNIAKGAERTANLIGTEINKVNEEIEKATKAANNYTNNAAKATTQKLSRYIGAVGGKNKTKNKNNKMNRIK
jgi:hypothetical protein